MLFNIYVIIYIINIHIVLTIFITLDKVESVSRGEEELEECVSNFSAWDEATVTVRIVNTIST